MLRPATVVDLPVLRALIRDGAMTGAFDRELAADAGEGRLFFANLRQALASGYFVEKDPATGELSTVAAPGFVYVPDAVDAVHSPIGFGLFKAAPAGYELWLLGIDAEWRGRGHGRAMLTELLTTPPGQKAWFARVTARGHAAGALDHLLRACGYARVTESPQGAWYLRADAPDAARRHLLPARAAASTA